MKVILRVSAPEVDPAKIFTSIRLLAMQALGVALVIALALGFSGGLRGR